MEASLWHVRSHRLGHSWKSKPNDVEVPNGTEQIIGGLSSSVAPYLPYTAAATLAGTKSREGMPQRPSGLNALSFDAAVPLLAGIAFVVATAPAFTTSDETSR